MTFSYVSTEDYLAYLADKPLKRHEQAFLRLISVHPDIYVIKNEKDCYKILGSVANFYANDLEIEEGEDGIVFARPFFVSESVQVFTTEYEWCVGYKKATGFGYEMNKDLDDTLKAFGWDTDIIKMIKDWFKQRQPAEYLL